jgi:hypothetical protein
MARNVWLFVAILLICLGVVAQPQAAEALSEGGCYPGDAAGCRRPTSRRAGLSLHQLYTGAGPRSEEDTYFDQGRGQGLVRQWEEWAVPGSAIPPFWSSRIAWISWLNIAVLLATLSLALFNASKDQIAQNFAYTYALISVGVLVRKNAVTRECHV